jgi:hypothetical protein
METERSMPSMWGLIRCSRYDRSRTDSRNPNTAASPSKRPRSVRVISRCCMPAASGNGSFAVMAARLPKPLAALDAQQQAEAVALKRG